MEGFLDPQEVLKELELRKDMTAADFGSGSGGWAIPLAKRLTDGKIYAIDILEEPLSALKNKSGVEGIVNIETIRSDVESRNGSTLKDKYLDLVLITNLLFQTENKKMVLTETKRVLKNGGKVLVVDWNPEAAFGPEVKKTSSKEIKKLAKEIGFSLVKEFKAGDYHFGLLFSKL
jgi:ubiquinone/menaquinone biosynthesis C-methylase UbiE